MKTIEITISPTGESRIESQGFSGSRCREASRLIEQALGRITSERLTAEYYAESTTEDRERQRE